MISVDCRDQAGSRLRVRFFNHKHIVDARLTLRTWARMARTNWLISLGSKPKYVNSTRPSRMIKAGWLSVVSLMTASQVGLSVGIHASSNRDGVPTGGVGKDEGETVVNSFVFVVGRFVPCRWDQAQTANQLMERTIFFKAISKFDRPWPLKSTHIIYKSA